MRNSKAEIDREKNYTKEIQHHRTAAGKCLRWHIYCGHVNIKLSKPQSQTPLEIHVHLKRLQCNGE